MIFSAKCFLNQYRQGSFFTCQHFFRPTGKSIEIGLGGNIGEPMIGQQNFIIAIEKNYSSIIETAVPIIEDEFSNWKEGFMIRNFHHEFSPVYIDHTQFSHGSFEWNISFESIHDLNHQFIVTIKDFIARSVIVDG